jgi:hypothetical protein
MQFLTFYMYYKFNVYSNRKNAISYEFKVNYKNTVSVGTSGHSGCKTRPTAC